MDLQPENNSIIDKNRMQEHALDFNFLRTKGIELIQQFAGKQWSDFNLHDPGITMLEYLCYGLTDVAYRTTFPITDLLADKKGNINRAHNFFLTKEEALSSGPVTINDYRKLLIDLLPGVDDVWLEPITSPYGSRYSKGVYQVVIKPSVTVINQLAAAVDAAVDEITGQLIRSVRAILMDYRNIGDHYEVFRVLRPQPVYIKAAIVIEKSADPEVVMTAIYKVLAAVLNPIVTYCTEAELLAKGYAIEDIYAGPLLQNGIIPDHELKDRITGLDPFRLIKVISGVKGIISIRQLQLSSNGKDYDSKILPIDERYFPYLMTDEVNPDITLYNDNYPLYIQKLDVLKKEQQAKRKMGVTGISKKPEVQLKGNYKSLQDYVSIQTLFPAIYGISEETPASRLPADEIAKSRQLKAYLMLFEQLLANSLSQLASISDLFSTDLSVAATYHFQPLYDVPDAKYILKAFTDGNDSLSTASWEAFKHDPDNDFIRAVKPLMETDEEHKDRKKRAFDHILSRFNIAVHKHPVFLYEFYYDNNNSGQRTDLEIRWKAAILRNLSAFTSNRIKADNYLTLSEDEGLENGFGRKMSLLLHIKSGSRRRLSKIIEKYKNHLLVNTPAGKENLPEEVVRFNWRDEELSILFNTDEKEIADNPSLTHRVTFKQQSELLFQSAMVLKNYRIIPYPLAESNEFVLLFKHPQEIVWNRLSKHPDEYAALKALKKTMHYFKQLSMDSEGFYMLEHLLLKPSFQEEQYGFEFTDQHSQPLIRQLNWQSFAQREATVAALLELSALCTADNYLDTAARLFELCIFTPFLQFFPTPSDQPLPAEQQKQEAVEYLLYNLKQFALRSADVYPAFNYTIKPENGTEIGEDFFNFRMTVVFPSWPARFQDNSFRELAEDLFREECPAHMKLSFLWLSLKQMEAFDTLYFNWLEGLKEGGDPVAAHSISEQLSRFLLNNLTLEDKP
ncbi:hypothetical protein [Pedobacter sp. L105]|uniref:hypothetical protein n=1 Tax=Pedobacter sp. L105 TaxID=1641871 RepID=UPI00131E7583|nr:hypothetical protein [Pedobacter sp. L105]